MQLRPYQQEAEDAIFNYFATHDDPTRNPVIAMPTGTGKAVNIASFTRRVIQTWPSQRIIMMTHVKELVSQNADKLLTMWPQAPLGIYSAGLGEKSAHMPITFAGIQSAAKQPQLFGHQDLGLIDECHLVSPNENTYYQQFIKAMREVNPLFRVIGFSATPYRLGLGMITDGGVFTDVAYDITGLAAFNRLLDEGYLSPLVPMPTDTEIDLSGVHIKGGEFVPGELENALDEQTTWSAVREAVEKAGNRNHLLFFVPGIAKVKLVVSMLEYLGISAAGVHSNSKEHKMSDFERDDNLARFKSGQIRALVNADVLTTGFDFPALDCIVMLRATNSPGLWVQMLGRGTRPLYMPGFDLNTRDGRLAAMVAGPKQNCLVLDFAGNTMRLGPINDPRIPSKKGKGTGEIPIKQCDDCGCLNHISARFCLNCGAEFVFQEKITANASTAALIVRDEPQVELFKVDRVTYSPHIKFGSPPSLKVSYFCGMRRFTEWVCLEHRTGIEHKAQAWWRKRSDVPPPSTIEEALTYASQLKVPNQIRVWVNRKYPEILAHLFDDGSQHRKVVS